MQPQSDGNEKARRDGCDKSPEYPAQEQEREVSAFLVKEVAKVSRGDVLVVDTPDRGRCLKAAVELPAGKLIRDRAVIPAGSDLGLHVARALTPGISAGETFSSGDFLAGIDFLASLLEALAGKDRQTGADKVLVDFDMEENLRLLWSLYCFEAPQQPPEVPLVRTWHPRWREDLARVPVEEVESAWQHVVPNWRRLVVSFPEAQCLEGAGGAQQLSLGHRTVCGLWLLMSLCEHSCSPNCGLLHDGRDLLLVTLRPLAAGEHLSSSYLALRDLCRSTDERQQELRQAWGFGCRCSRCQGLIPERLRRRPLAGLFDVCLSPPGEDEAERSAYCRALAALASAAAELHACTWEPTALSLAMLRAFFAPSAAQASALTALAQVLEGLFGGAKTDTADDHWMLLLARMRAPVQYLECLLANAPGVAEPFELELEVSEAARHGQDACQAEVRAVEDPEHVARRRLRGLYRGYLMSRCWPRRRQGNVYVASKTSS